MFELLERRDFTEWRAASGAACIEERARAGETRDEAPAKADAAKERQLPGGSPGPGQYVGRLIADGARVGLLWIGPLGDDPTRWWVWSVEVDPRRAMPLEGTPTARRRLTDRSTRSTA